MKDTDVTLQSKPAWHSLSTDEVINKLACDVTNGLKNEEAGRRLSEYGPNCLPPPKTRGPIIRFLSQFNNLLIYVLLAAALVTALLNHWIDTGVILAVVLINSIIGFVQEGKAEEALNAIREMLSPSASVLRNGQRVTVPADNLVPGDIVLLEPGDKVPADIRLIRLKGLQVQESALTGESVPVDKRVEIVTSSAPLGDRYSMAYSGTLVTSGQGSGVVVETGIRTEIGHISMLLSEVQQLTTPLLRAMNVFARLLTVLILAVAGAVLAFGVLARGYGMVDMFMASVGIAVAAIPEGLPAILTVTLAIGVQRMASRNAIVRRLPAVETLGSVSIICSDKTGTLTRNEMTVRSILVDGLGYEVSGVGYDPHGGFSLKGVEILPEEYPLLKHALCAMALCNDAMLRKEGDNWIMEGNPMEGALITAAMKGGLDPSSETDSTPRTDIIPFDAQHRFMATLHHDHKGNGYIYVKGAPEQVLEMCGHESSRDGNRPINKSAWLAQVEKMASQGQRVLAVAYLPTHGDHATLCFDDVLKGNLILLGFFGLIDPPRMESIQAVKECQNAGIRVKMITGDHAGTARAIAQQLGLINVEDVITGELIDGMADDELRSIAPGVDVFARTTPEHKLRLVQALQAHGHVVAMTGDGVNDAPALKQADIGVAMGQKGTETAKEASEMVLADDNFSSIAWAVREGRTVYDNLKKAILFLLPVNGGESGSIILAIMLGQALPITPLQVLWVNMVSSVALAMSLAFAPAERDIMKRPARKPGEPMLSGFLLWRIFLVSSLFLAGIFYVYIWALERGLPVEVARTYAVNTLVVMEIFYLFSVSTLRESALISWSGFFGSRSVLIAISVTILLQLIFTYAPFMNLLFDTRPMNFTDGIYIVLIGLAVFFVLEVEKAAWRWFGSRLNFAGSTAGG